MGPRRVGFHRLGWALAVGRKRLLEVKGYGGSLNRSILRTGITGRESRKSRRAICLAATE